MLVVIGRAIRVYSPHESLPGTTLGYSGPTLNLSTSALSFAREPAAIFTSISLTGSGWYRVDVYSADDYRYTCSSLAKPRHFWLVAQIVSAPAVEVGRRGRPPSARNTQARQGSTVQYVLRDSCSIIDSCTHVNIAR